MIQDPVKKGPVTPDNFWSNPNPFLFSNTIITNGNCKALVCAVGPNTYARKNPGRIDFEDTLTPTQKRLTRIASQIQLAAVLVSAVVFAGLLIRVGIQINDDPNRHMFTSQTLQ